MTEKPMVPADPNEIADRITFALTHRRNGKAARDFDRALAVAAGEHVAEALRLSGYVMMKQAPLEAHAGDTAWRDRGEPDQS